MNNKKQKNMNYFLKLNTTTTLYSVLIKNEMPFLMVDKSSLKNFILDARKVKGVKQSELNRL